jgi:hypothetical protein
MQPKPPPIDNTAESDLEFFRRCPGINSRKRLAFDNEPPPGLLERGDEYDNVAFISVRLERDASGLPATITRAIVYGEWGHA